MLEHCMIEFKNGNMLASVLYQNVRMRVLSKFYYQPMHKRNALKGVLKFSLKMLQHVSV